MMTRSSFSTSHWIVLIAVVVAGLLPEAIVPAQAARIREIVRSRLMSKADYDRMERGYYEQILDTGRRMDTHGLIAINTNDLRESVLKPNYTTILPVGAIWNTNALAMRDQPYSTAKPSGTFRLAMAGDSIGVGLGVDDGLGFEPVLERSLRKRSREVGGPTVEFLNFALPGKSPGQRWDHFMQVAWPTSPDVVVFEATQADVGWDERRLVDLLPRGIGWDSAVYGDLFERSGLKKGQPKEYYAEKLAALRWDLVGEVYKHIAADCRERGVPCLWVLIPRVGRPVEPADHDRLVSLAKAAGFGAEIDISDAYDGLDPLTLAIRPADYHPNARGHALLADRLDAAFLKQPSLQHLSARKAEGAATPRF
ncbi:SGNH/GDSL hydrolase family protein [Singulisphaera sp. PoT]|uniref:SGNH/GDSL hydrolase family protein n=1 Tax=Singulisphaera sp. PoT TaxID=3411797 RepID=UPI003BF4A3EC